MLDAIMAVILGIMFIGLVFAFAWVKADRDLKKPEKRKAMKRLEWYKQHRINAKYRRSSNV